MSVPEKPLHIDIPVKLGETAQLVLVWDAQGSTLKVSP